MKQLKKLRKNNGYMASMIKDLHKRLFKTHSSFGYAAVTALVIGIGDVIATIGALVAIRGDLLWLLGDMSHSPQPYHQTIYTHLMTSAILTVIGLVIMIGSFIWLYRSIVVYLRKMEKKKQNEYDMQYRRYNAPTHCDLKPKPLKPIDYSIEYED